MVCFPLVQIVKNLPAMQETWVLEFRKIPGRRKLLSTPVFLPGEFHEQRSLVGYSPWSSKELDMTEGLSLSWCVEVPKFCITKYVFLPFMVSAVYVLVCQLSPPPPPSICVPFWHFFTHILPSFCFHLSATRIQHSCVVWGKGMRKAIPRPQL